MSLLNRKDMGKRGEKFAEFMDNHNNIRQSSEGPNFF